MRELLEDFREAVKELSHEISAFWKGGSENDSY